MLLLQLRQRGHQTQELVPAVQLEVAILAYHMGQLDDVLALLVTLRVHVGTLVLPADCGAAVDTEDVRHGVRARVEFAPDCRSAGDVNY